MRQNLVGINGVYYDIRIPQNGIKRSFSVTDSDKAGRTLSGDMKRAIIGTYYNYTVQMDMSQLSKNEYDAVYEVLSSPVDYHIITMPYGQDTLTFKAYVTNGEDTLNKVTSSGKEWSGLSINFISMSPQRKAV